MGNCRNTLSAICLFQIFGGTIQNPFGLGISKKTIRNLLDQDWLIQISQNGYQLKTPPSDELPSPYHLIDKPLPFKGTPFLYEKPSIGLGNLLSKYQFKTVIELGSSTGMSTIFIATFLPKNGKVLSISNWDDYDQLLSNVIRTKLTDSIIPICHDPMDMPPRNLPKADVVYFNAPKDRDDILTILNHWGKNGLKLCGHQQSGAMEKNLLAYAKSRGLRYTAQGEFWVIA